MPMDAYVKNQREQIRTLMLSQYFRKTSVNQILKQRMVINIETKAENNEIDTKRKNKTKGWFSENIDMIQKHLAKLIKKEKTQKRDENGIITTGYN